MNDAHLDGFLFHWIHPHHRRAQWRDPTVQHPPRELNLVLAGATSGYHTQVEKDSGSRESIFVAETANTEALKPCTLTEAKCNAHPSSQIDGTNPDDTRTPALKLAPSHTARSSRWLNALA